VVGVYDFSVIFLSMIGLGVNDGVSRRSNARIERSRARIGGSTAPASRRRRARAAISSGVDFDFVRVRPRSAARWC
jgi:hypothetical protein